MKKILAKRLARKAVAVLVALAGTTTTFDLTPIINVVIAVIPIFVILLVVRLIFQSLRNVGE